jgi:hypothetical protein
LTRLLAAIDAGEVKRLIVYSIDRLTRRLFHLQELLARFNRNEVELLVVTDPRFGGAAASRLMTNIVAAASEFEIELTRERLSDARAALKCQGKRVAGRVPFGYRVDTASKTLTPHPEQSPIVAQLFELASQGLKPSELADHANSSQWRNHQNETGRWTSPKPGVLETWDTERGLSETKASGSGKESPRLPKTGSSSAEISLDSSPKSRSAATLRWIPRSMISAIDRKRTAAGSPGRLPSSGRVSKEEALMVPSP